MTRPCPVRPLASPPSASPWAWLWAGLLVGLGGCSGGGGDTDQGASTPLGLTIDSPEPEGSYPPDGLTLDIGWSSEALDPDGFELRLNGTLVQTQLTQGLDKVSGPLPLPGSGAYILEVRALRGGQLIDSAQREFFAAPAFPGLAQRQLFIGDLPSIAFAQTGSGLGDLDGDGSHEIVLGARQMPLGGPLAGRIQVVPSAGGAPLLEVFGQAGSSFSHDVRPFPDQDGDGRPDLLVGAPRDSLLLDGAGAVWLLSSQTGAALLTLRGSDLQEHLGNAVANAGDINGDGVPDILVGGAESNVAGGFAGRVSVFSGADGARLLKIEGEAPVVQLGIAVDGFGDQNGDGVPDLLVGSWGATDNGGSSGAVIVFSGQDGSQLLRIPGEFKGDHLGLDLATVPDLNADGINEILAGAFEYDPPGASNAGAAYVFDGRSGAIVHKWVGAAEEDRMGTRVACPGDMDGDGLADLLVAAPFTEATRGRVHLFSGLTGKELARIEGATAIALAGAGLEALGDIDGDGFPEFLMGSPVEVFAQQPLGTARLFGRAQTAALLQGASGPSSPAQPTAADPIDLGDPATLGDLGLSPAQRRELAQHLLATWPLLPAQPPPPAPQK